MKKWMLFLMAVLFVATQAVAQQTPPQRVTPQAGEMPQIVAFDNDGLLGDHIHIFGNVTDLGKWGNSISSMVILSGRWEFFDQENFQGMRMNELGPGVYLTVKDHGLKDNSISSIRLVSPMGR
jgi:Beta/Gamma crystallin